MYIFLFHPHWGKNMSFHWVLGKKYRKKEKGGREGEKEKENGKRKGGTREGKERR